MKLIFITAIFCLWFSCLSTTSNGQPLTNEQSNKKVKVSVYYETLCFGCRYEFLNVIVPTRKALWNYLDLELIPFGNARIHPKQHSIQCQHGELECYGNQCQACAQDLFGFEKFYNYTRCMFESENYDDPTISAEECAPKVGIDFQKIDTCAKGEHGYQLALKLGKKTNAVHRKYVPWIMIEGKTYDPRNKNLKDYICKNYLANENIPACKTK
ncbi:gamma-interferon-inducible lysosomal thiol reductase-like [Dermatophagoides pteronyssinus]|uniref:Gamma-interferon-inducible lysosomal thiol reductase-like isoform X1 n=1 Tax=Dermatophagoides pteronyssinus TaxID=6956 RepID=A0A6P6XPT3_DERPT|nr:gamma-interferon-inducible lysosomal thiol reductase-like isoform X1 [Dermatophagoides pteronyssinus]